MLERLILILYGSQSGTAQDVAERIWRESKFFKFKGPVMCMDDYFTPNLIFEPLVIFVASTTGQGEEPDNMKLFWKFLLRKNLPSDSLKSLKFAVLGLGDSSYVKFNFVAKRLNRRLESLGGVAIVEPGYADDQHDLGADAVVDRWLANLWSTLGGIFNFTPEPVKLIPEPRWRVELAQSKDAVSEDDSNKPKEHRNVYTQRNPCRMAVMDNIRTTSIGHFQDVRLIKLAIPDSLKYNAGDVLMLVPQNSEEAVGELFRILNADRVESAKIDPDIWIQVSERDSDLPVPESLLEPITLRECAKKYWDLNAVPRRQVFSLLGYTSPNELEKEKLQEFSIAEGQEDLYNYCNRPRRNILEVLSDFPHTTRAISVQILFDVFQPIRPRAFSIASSPSSTPLIMVGPGTGVAPFRSYVQELAALSSASSSNLLMFFGCRNKEADFHCADEWQQLVDTNQLTLIGAFSRDQSNKIYVQHRIIEHGNVVWHFLQRQAYILIAGSSKNMPQSVREAFVEVVRTHGNLSADDAETFIAQMEWSGRYQTETWS